MHEHAVCMHACVWRTGRAGSRDSNMSALRSRLETL